MYTSISDINSRVKALAVPTRATAAVKVARRVILIVTDFLKKYYYYNWFVESALFEKLGRKSVSFRFVIFDSGDVVLVGS